MEVVTFCGSPLASDPEFGPEVGGRANSKFSGSAPVDVPGGEPGACWHQPEQLGPRGAAPSDPSDLRRPLLIGGGHRRREELGPHSLRQRPAPVFCECRKVKALLLAKRSPRPFWWSSSRSRWRGGPTSWPWFRCSGQRADSAA